MINIQQLLQKDIIFLDGAFGTELLQQGMPPGVCPEVWCLENPRVLSRVHQDYVAAGADIFYTCTLGGNPFKLAEYGHSHVFEINRDLALLAREAANGQALVAGNLSASGKFIEPFGPLPFEEAVSGFKVQVKGLLAGGVDLFVIETMYDIQEARAALLAVKETCDLFTLVTMTFEKGGRTLNGTAPAAAVVTLQHLGADAVGCNCGAGPAEMVPLIRGMQPSALVPLAAKPNAGLPELKDGKTYFPMQPPEFAKLGVELVAAGAKMIGGCCGTSPAHIRALIDLLKDKAPPEAENRPLPALSSAFKLREIKHSHRIYVIGERINPTGKKKLQQALLSGQFSYVRELAKQQELQGADLLDVNAGVPGADEKTLLRQLTGLLALHTPLPLVIDSTSPEAIAAALRIYPGRALVNSITGEQAKMKQLFPIAAKYGAMLICLPLTDQGVPRSAEERIEIIQQIIHTGRQYGFTEKDYIIDGLVMAASSSPDAPCETLKTIRLCSKVMGLQTVIGLSNVSFGLPRRQWLNAAFLAMAAAHGLAFAIADPGSPEITQIKLASDLLQGADPGAKRYLAFTQAQTGAEPAPTTNKNHQDPLQMIRQHILDGMRKEILPLLDQALARGVPAEDLISSHMIPAITAVGDLYEQKRLFLPQLIASAETMQQGFHKLKPLLKKTDAAGLGTIVAATVQGDIHDIGKNIVTLMLANSGFTIIDLGKDVPNSLILETAREQRAEIILLSALMTTTMVRMKELVTAVRSSNLPCQVMVGGAVITAEYAAAIGAHYAADSVGAVKLARQLLKKQPDN